MIYGGLPQIVSFQSERRNDIEPEDNETKLVARALLPPEIMEGSILKYEMLQYEIIG